MVWREEDPGMVKNDSSEKIKHFREQCAASMVQTLFYGCRDTWRRGSYS